MAFLIEFLTKGRLFGLQVGVRVWGGNIQTVADLIGTFPGLCEALWGLGVEVLCGFVQSLVWFYWAFIRLYVGAFSERMGSLKDYPTGIP